MRFITAHSSTPICLLFLDTRDLCGADVAVHLFLMSYFAWEEVEVFVLSNSEAADADEMRVRRLACGAALKGGGPPVVRSRCAAEQSDRGSLRTMRGSVRNV
jgi:hypothetical protein